MDTQEARIFTAIIISVIVIGVILFYFALSVIRQQKRNLNLQNALTLAEISAMEKERARIARDLHDQISPMLSVVKFHIDVKVPDPEEREQIKKASDYLDDIILMVREISVNLLPGTLIRKGLLDALNEFINSISEAGQLKINFTHPKEIFLPEDKNINIFRAVQEVLHNTLKHASASSMDIVIKQNKDMLTVLCKDDGVGFDYVKVLKEGKGMGLGSLRNRASLMGGTLIVESQKGRGSAFLFEIPIN